MLTILTAGLALRAAGTCEDNADFRDQFLMPCSAWALMLRPEGGCYSLTISNDSVAEVNRNCPKTCHNCPCTCESECSMGEGNAVPWCYTQADCSDAQTSPLLPRPHTDVPCRSQMVDLLPAGDTIKLSISAEASAAVPVAAFGGVGIKLGGYLSVSITKFEGTGFSFTVSGGVEVGATAFVGPGAVDLEWSVEGSFKVHLDEASEVWEALGRLQRGEVPDQIVSISLEGGPSVHAGVSSGLPGIPESLKSLQLEAGITVGAGVVMAGSLTLKPRASVSVSAKAMVSVGADASAVFAGISASLPSEVEVTATVYLEPGINISIASLTDGTLNASLETKQIEMGSSLKISQSIDAFVGFPEKETVGASNEAVFSSLGDPEKFLNASRTMASGQWSDAINDLFSEAHTTLECETDLSGGFTFHTGALTGPVDFGAAVEISHVVKKAGIEIAAPEDTAEVLPFLVDYLASSLTSVLPTTGRHLREFVQV